MKKISFIGFILLLVITFGLSSCDLFSSGPDPFINEEICAEGYFANLKIKLNKTDKTAKVLFDDFESSSYKLTFLKETTTFEHLEKNAIGIETRYETKYFFYEIKLNEEEANVLSTKFRNIIDEKFEEKTTDEALVLLGVTISKVGFYVDRRLANGKALRSDIYKACAINDGSNTFYDGNLDGKLVRS